MTQLHPMAPPTAPLNRLVAQTAATLTDVEAALDSFFY